MAAAYGRLSTTVSPSCPISANARPSPGLSLRPTAKGWGQVFQALGVARPSLPSTPSGSLSSRPRN